MGKGEIACNFSFFCSVFKRLKLQTRKNQGLFGKGLKAGSIRLISEVVLYQNSGLLKQWIAQYRWSLTQV